MLRSSGYLFPLVLIAASAVNGQYSSDVDLHDLESQNYILPNGEPYRDLLTIGASKAVAEFAERLEPGRRQKVKYA